MLPPRLAEARALSELGLTVVGTGFAVDDTSSIEFAGGFYRQLAKDDDVLTAVRVGRKNIRKKKGLNVFVLYENGKKKEI